MNVLDTLKARGFLKQTVYGDELYKLLDSEKISFYVGFDPTADSLHIGHYIPIMAMAHMQRAGHRPIALFGGGTAMVGDPSGRTDMRSMLTQEQILHNISRFKEQMSRFISFEGENRMLTAECFKQRLEKGLTFLEFNYMLMQGYDYLRLYEDYGCKLEMGGDDQWSNMLAGVDLVRRKHSEDVFAATCSLLLTSEGKKNGQNGERRALA